MDLRITIWNFYAYARGWRPVVYMQVPKSDPPEWVQFWTPSFRRFFQRWRHYRKLGYR